MAPIYDMIVIGGGPGGYTAALYAARAGRGVLVLEKLSAGGQMALTDQIDNYPGFPNGVDGFTLGEDMRLSAERFGVKTELAEVFSVDLQATVKILNTSEGIFYARTVVLATGANPRTLNIPGEKAFTARGVHYCAHCDGMFYRGKTVAVIGGGNSAVQDALILSKVAKKVILVHRRDTLRAERIHQDALKRAENVEFRWNSTVTALQGDTRLTGAVLQDTRTGEESALACDGVFVSIGRAPATALAAGQLSMDAAGYLIADETTRTNLPGVFAVGDLRTKPLRQIVTATADGAVAAHFADLYLAQQETGK